MMLWSGKKICYLRSIILFGIVWCSVDSTTETLMTTFTEGSGSFGNMFDIQGKADLSVVGFDFHTDKDSDVTYEIYTRNGGYRGYETDSRGWEMVASGTVRGKGVGKPTPCASFTPIFIEGGSTVGFYFTLLTYDLRYTLGSMEGAVFAFDSHMSFTEGIGVAEYKFGETFFRPRIWNGIIHYTLAQTSKPIQSLKVPPTYAPVASPRLDTTTVSFYNRVEHPIIGGDIPSILQTVRISVERVLQKRLREINNHVFSIGGRGPISAASGNVYVRNIDTVIDSNANKEDCDMTNTFHETLCVPTKTIVKLAYENTIREEDVRYQITSYSSDVTRAINENNQFNAKYVGALPTETTSVFTLSGADLSKMNTQHDVDFFETSVKKFLDMMFRRGPISVYGVGVKGQKLNNRRHLKMQLFQENLGMRSLLSSSNKYLSSLDVTAVITGEYLPPPHINVGELIDESFAESGEYFLEELKQNDKFKGVSHLDTSSRTTVMVPTLSPTIGTPIDIVGNEPTRNDIDAVNNPIAKFFYSMYGMVLASLLLLISFCLSVRQLCQGNLCRGASADDEILPIDKLMDDRSKTVPKYVRKLDTSESFTSIGRSLGSKSTARDFWRPDRF